MHSLIQTAALEALVACGCASSSQHELNEALYWLTGYARDRTVRALREAGWLEYRPGAGAAHLYGINWILGQRR